MSQKETARNLGKAAARRVVKRGPRPRKPHYKVGEQLVMKDKQYTIREDIELDVNLYCDFIKDTLGVCPIESDVVNQALRRFFDKDSMFVEWKKRRSAAEKPKPSSPEVGGDVNQRSAEVVAGVNGATAAAAANAATKSIDGGSSTAPTFSANPNAGGAGISGTADNLDVMSAEDVIGLSDEILELFESEPATTNAVKLPDRFRGGDQTSADHPVTMATQTPGKLRSILTLPSASSNSEPNSETD